ncbi:Binding-protein-dependent transport systems inner membrane component [Anaerovibrio sp. JC8]|uniref:ABC transporter permease n=1 Tax=Anaerovibrio sp. JC8 TaxID=1240085 RepID=UPI000A0C63CD|nr:ABC transporter permease [Anaerovibrio sp. JC8]ORU00750.1 Binding-protein-dependent transport systems inner membrane component [Anaerovibrio sp. JC8]
MGKLVSVWYLLAAVALTIIWFVVAKVVDLPIIPSPVLVVENLADIFMKYIAIHSLYSLWRIAAGLLLAIAVGLPLGVIMGYFPQTDRFLAPVVYLTYPIPKIALLPILMLLFGVGELSKVFMIFLIIVFQVVVAVRDGIRAIPNETYYPLYSLGASFKDIFFEVLWPASLPKFITAIRVALATAISVLFFTETFGTQYGMGYFIMDAWLRVNYLEMYSGIVVLSLLGLILFTTIDLIERNACHWQYK